MSLQRPDTKEIISKVRQIDIKTNRLVEGIISGAYLSAFKGTGIEFGDVREYNIGDDPRTIDWNVTARMNHPYVKEFIEERDLTLMIMFDISRSSEFGTARSIKKDTGIELCASLAMSAMRNNDRVGLMLATDRVEKYLPPMKGKKQAFRIIRETISHEPLHNNTDLSVPLAQLSKILKKRSIIFVISDFQDDIQRFKKPLQILKNRHDLIAVKLFDIREHVLPDIGLIELEDVETGEQILVDTGDAGFRKKYRENIELRNRELSEVMKHLEVDMIEISTSEDWIQPVLRFFSMRSGR
ncbi:hypothetical protein ANME2D_00628 [Candidatus Methanoperedens nitroreducens]|uniref:DUF58 domain-containing protein n=1 Tax=Candidatus Methanoperedens nitratireducens TaxID=1392998 RepID=A0A062V8D8_9EURY|nr:hypothetical protein ANME2D_00628 [Candidatus Methanoperedens nitroreducens]MDJ1422483.1 DUF58 domain-containing protein [Candidatus Methanoperedens sp.]